jgi:hypothetical protein
MDRRTFVLLTGAAPVLRNAAWGVWIGDAFTSLADAAPAGDVVIEAEFPPSESDARGAITVSLYPDRVPATIRGVRFCATSEPQVLPGDGPLVALVNGYQSWSGCRMATLPADATSYGALGVSRGGAGWDSGGIRARARALHARSVNLDGRW